MEKTDFLYYGIFIDNNTRLKLNEYLSNIWRYDVALSFSEKQYIHHCTVLHKTASYKKDILSFCESHLGEKFSGKITAVGESGEAMAFRVEFPDVPFAGKIPHITIATFAGGKPVDSNYIEMWEDLEEPVEIIGTLGVHTPDGILFGGVD